MNRVYTRGTLPHTTDSAYRRVTTQRVLVPALLQLHATLRDMMLVLGTICAYTYDPLLQVISTSAVGTPASVTVPSSGFSI